ncbi:hypothetical protein CH373_15885 [Leptospira perolatii]|uniref:FHA domain-containing protein n=1 Tax=Leptospira perolatii TaxID=2023191 RepID=A0A2M9ZJB2_9LEPT|nr:FHA domain-containing protein [Leptospira perolatii]PJZ68204.1 hypothetical protein CH360_17455 [Leptospira perolatii]PJZ72139.1 hypothetical protein CH373_15885 [Leptospira perolatii]
MRRFRLTLFLFSVFACTTLLAENQGFVIEGIESKDYPKIRVLLKENSRKSLDREILTIKETKQGKTLRVIRPDLKREEGTRPIHVYVVAQMTHSLEANNRSTEFLRQIVESSEEEDRFSFVFFADDVYVPKLDLSRKEAFKEAKVDGANPNRSTGASLDYVFQKVSPKFRSGDYVLLLLNDLEIMPTNDARRGAYSSGTPIHLFAYPSKGAKWIAEKHAGLFYSNLDRDGVREILSDIEYFRRFPWVLSYESPFKNEWSWAESPKIKIEIETPSKISQTSEYTLSIRTKLLVFFLNPAVFLPTMGFLLILTMFALLVVLRKSPNARLQMPGSVEERMQTLDEEQDVYRKMYGDQFQYVYAEDERVEPERAIPVSLKEFEQGEEYEKATLILKEGRNPGKQFSLQKSETTIGNSELADLVLYEQGVSKNHTRIRRVKNRYVLYDLVSEVGTFLNGKKVLRPRILYDFDEIGIGKALLVFRGK